MAGSVNHCPICGSALDAGDGELFGNLACPRCEARLWVVVQHGGYGLFLRGRRASLDRLIETLAAIVDEIESDVHVDSLDMVELRTELEELLTTTNLIESSDGALAHLSDSLEHVFSSKVNH